MRAIPNKISAASAISALILLGTLSPYLTVATIIVLICPNAMAHGVRWRAKESSKISPRNACISYIESVHEFQLP